MKLLNALLDIILAPFLVPPTAPFGLRVAFVTFLFGTLAALIFVIFWREVWKVQSLHIYATLHLHSPSKQSWSRILRHNHAKSLQMIRYADTVGTRNGWVMYNHRLQVHLPMFEVELNWYAEEWEGRRQLSDDERDHITKIFLNDQEFWEYWLAVNAKAHNQDVAFHGDLYNPQLLKDIYDFRANGVDADETATLLVRSLRRAQWV